MQSRPTSLTVWALWFAMAFTLQFVGCSRDLPWRHEGSVASTAAWQLWPDSIDFRNGLVIRAFGDSLLQVRVEGNCLRDVSCRPRMQDAAAVYVSTGVPLIDALCALETRVGLPDTWNSNITDAVFLNPLSVRWATGMLRGRLKDGYVVPGVSQGLTWPVVTENPYWLLAAIEVAKAGGGRQWLDEVAEVAGKMLEEDVRIAYNPFTSLFYGMPQRWTAFSRLTPDWMLPADQFAVQSFSVNAAYCGALYGLADAARALAMRNEKFRHEITTPDADSLRHALHRAFWLPGQQMFGAMLYGFQYAPVCAEFADNVAQAVAVMAGVISEPVAQAIFTRGVPSEGNEVLFHPSPVPVSVDHAGGMDLALLASAAAGVGATDAYNRYFAALIATQAQRLLGTGAAADMACAPLNGVILRGVLGARFTFDNMTLSPNVPRWFGGETVIRGLKWRKAVLNITVRGHGRKVRACTINGGAAPLQLPSDAEGEQNILIELDVDNADGSDDDTPVGGSEPLPSAPEVAWPTRSRAVIMSDGNDTRDGGLHRVWLNGVPDPEGIGNTFELAPVRELTSVQIATLNSEGAAGFSARPHLIIPDRAEIRVRLSDVARSGARMPGHDKVSDEFVESDRNHNRNIRFDVVAPAEGDYIVDVHYMSGLGIVNARRRTALRHLMVNDTHAGVLVFPQLTPYNRGLRGDASDRLQATSFSNPLPVHLLPGDNRIELRYFQVTPVYLDPTTNGIVADYVRFIPVVRAQGYATVALEQDLTTE